ncbi:MAG: formate hydrogenlyase subunit 3/multisubunit Na+/H+ antiporter, MnhD subunit [Firmicutes bacterium]|nr:formate hydrogenlyase subunit 3/multisubunit Na+/H+ antiporter, MnhD subunit [Bacillota bacterium]
MFIGVAVIAAVGMLFSAKDAYLRLLNSVALVLLTLSGGWTIRQTLSQGSYTYGSGFLYWDALSALLLSVIIMIAVYVILFSFGYMEEEISENETEVVLFLDMDLRGNHALGRKHAKFGYHLGRH